MRENAEDANKNPEGQKSNEQFDLQATLKKLNDDIANLKRPSDTSPKTFREFCLGFTSSGLFYMLLGGVLLFIAQWRIETMHAAFTFVLVVLGIALLLYGTGTQSAGNFSSDTTAAKYNVAIAGGAGVLALCVAFGMVTYYPMMADTFRAEKKYLRVLIKSTDGSSKIAYYTSQFFIDGTPIPSVLRGNSYIEVFVPYTLADLNTIETAAQSSETKSKNKAASKGKGIGCEKSKALTLQASPEEDDESSSRKRISGMFYRMPESGTNAVSDHRINGKFDQLVDMVPREFVIRLNKSSFRQTSGGQDFPEYEEVVCVNLQNDKQADALLEANRKLASNPNNGQNFDAKGALKAPSQPAATEPPEVVTK
ncbi:hypothetical protein [Bradyrhizobium sp. USDA 3650]